MRTFHIGGTASRISDQNTLDARHSGTVHYEGMVVVETHKEGGQLIVMNRNGSLVMKDEKGHDRERYPIVYGARLQMKDGQKVEVGQTIVEWDPYTFSILTEELVLLSHILTRRSDEEVDEVTGLARSFFAAGAHAVIGSRWPLRDADAAQLFDSFYRHLTHGASLSEALNATLVALRYE
jgi:DNA-directed RNA polymerase subunit beta'